MPYKFSIFSSYSQQLFNYDDHKCQLSWKMTLISPSSFPPYYDTPQKTDHNTGNSKGNTQQAKCHVHSRKIGNRAWWGSWKREQLMHHMFGEAICDLNNNFTIQAINIQTVCMYLQVIMPSWYANSLQLEEVLSLTWRVAPFWLVLLLVDLHQTLLFNQSCEHTCVGIPRCEACLLGYFHFEILFQD